jgi:hypothetical protein
MKMTALLLLLVASAMHPVASQETTVMRLEGTPCTDFENSKTAFDAAKAAWTEPDCYDYSYTFLGFRIGVPEAKAVQIRNGVADGDDKTINDFFDMIESLCIADCPAQGADQCSVAYATEGYPLSIFIDVSKYQADDERIYELTNFAVVLCPATQLAIEDEDPELRLEGSLEVTPCTNWEETKAALDAAKAIWSEPDCYDFSYTFFGFQVGLPEATAVQVRDSVVSGDGDKAIADFFDMIESLCVSNCPAEGASLCSISFATEGYPSSIFIDTSEYQGDDERIYEISDFVDCTGSSTQKAIVDGGQKQIETKCFNYVIVRAGLLKAIEMWSSPECYDFTFQWDGLRPIKVKVRNGVTLNKSRTINDFMEMIEMNCVSNCVDQSQENSSTMYECQITYAPEGYPIRIEMDPSKEVDDDAAVITLSDFSLVGCDASNHHAAVPR